MLSEYPLDAILTLPGVKELKEKQVTIKPESDVSKLYKPLTLKYLDLYLSTVNLGLPR
jgi:hypothetical protein